MLNKHLLISFIITILQFYNYTIFGIATLALSKEFMPEKGILLPILGVFSILGISVIGRPVGSLVFGLIGDRYGRWTTLKIAVLLSAISVLLVGLNPAYSYSKSYSIIIFVFSRVIFMMSLAGEGDGIRVYIFENVLPKYRNFANGVVSSCYQIGAVLAAISFWLTNSYSYDQELFFDFLPEYMRASFLSWRICFLASGILGVFIFLVANFIKGDEISNSNKIKNKDNNLTYYRKIIIDNRKFLFLGITIHGCLGGIYNFQVVFTGIYLSGMLGIVSVQDAAAISGTGLTLYAMIAPLAGYLADKINYKKQIMVSLGLCMLLCFTNLILLYQKIFYSALFILSIMSMPFFSIPLQVQFNSCLAVKTRLGIFSLSHSLGSMLISSQISLLASLIWFYSKSIVLTLSILMVLYAVLIVCAERMKSKKFESSNFEIDKL